jgi:hypothetical protein
MYKTPFQIYPVYAARVPNSYYAKTPLWSSPYTYCSSHMDCRRNTLDSKRCMPISGNWQQPCSAASPCICTNAVKAPF